MFASSLQSDVDVLSQVTKLTVAMLGQRLRTSEPAVEAVIASNLVDLALTTTEASFMDIIRAFSLISLSANPDDPRFSNNMVGLDFRDVLFISRRVLSDCRGADEAGRVVRVPLPHGVFHLSGGIRRRDQPRALRYARSGIGAGGGLHD